MKIFWLGMVKNRCGQSGLWTLKLILSQKGADGINWFFAWWHKFTQIKSSLKIFGVCMVKNECGQSSDRSLKFTLSEEWTDGINLFFPCWCRFTKIKSWLKFLGVGGVKNVCCQFGHGTLKWRCLRKEQTDFLHAGTNSGTLKVISMILG